MAMDSARLRSKRFLFAPRLLEFLPRSEGNHDKRPSANGRNYSRLECGLRGEYCPALGLDPIRGGILPGHRFLVHEPTCIFRSTLFQPSSGSPALWRLCTNPLLPLEPDPELSPLAHRLR